MPRFLRKFLPVEAGEEARIVQFGLLGLILQAGLTMGMNGADSIFLVTAGADKLPRIYLAMPAVMLVYIPLYSFLMGKLGMDRVFDLTLALLGAGGAALWFGLHHFGTSAVALCYAAKIWSAVWYVGLYTLYWNYIDGYFNLTDAKRLFALLAAGSALGAILGGCLVEPITARFGVPALFLAWAVCVGAAWPLALVIRQNFHKLESAEDDAEETSSGLLASLGMMGQVARNRYALVLALVLYFTLIAATTCEFQYLHLFSDGRGESQIASLLGHLTALANGFNLAVSLLVFNRLVARLGVRNVALLQSAAYALVFCWLLLDGGFPAAVAGFFAYQGLMTSIDFNNANLLFAGLPAESSKRLRTAIEGICEPLATATAGFLLLLVAPRLSPEQISLAGILIALAGLALVFVLRHDYVGAIAANLRGDWLDLSRSAEPLLGAPGPGDLALAEARANASGPAGAVLALRILQRGDPVRAAKALVGLLRRAPAGAHVPLRPVLDEALAQPGSPAAQEIQRWLGERDQPLDHGLAGELGRRHLLPARQAAALLEETEPEARAAGAISLWRSWRVPDNREALDQIAGLLSDDDERAVLAGIGAVGRLGEPRHAYLLRDYLRSPSPRLRRAALEALRALAAPSLRVLLPEVLVVLAESSGEDRSLALEAFEGIGDSGGLAALLASAERFTPAERRQAERMIVRLGQGTVPILIEVAQDLQSSRAGRSVALRALGKLAAPQARRLALPLVKQIVYRSYVFLGSRQALAERKRAAPGEPGQAVLSRICEDYPKVMMDLVLETLAVAGKLPEYETLTAALAGGPSKERGYAIETLEQACPPALFALLFPLLDGRPIEAQVAFARERNLIPRIDGDEVLARTLDTGLPIAAAAAAQALMAGGGADAPERLLTRLCRSPHPLLSRTAVVLLARRTGREGAVRGLTPVEAAHAFMSAPEFSGLRYPHHEFLVPHVRRVSAAAGEVLCPAGAELPGLWLVRTGAVLGGADRVGPGSVAGAGLLRGERRAAAGLAADGPLEALFLPAADLRRCLEIFPELGLALLAQKLAA